MQIVCNTKKVLGRNAKFFDGVWCGQKVAVKRVLLQYVSVYEEDNWQKLNHENVIKLLYAESNSVYRYKRIIYLTHQGKQFPKYDDF
jgi:hypothetical protein